MTGRVANNALGVATGALRKAEEVDGHGTIISSRDRSADHLSAMTSSYSDEHTYRKVEVSYGARYGIMMLRRHYDVGRCQTLIPVIIIDY